MSKRGLIIQKNFGAGKASKPISLTQAIKLRTE
jgi:hypothetical protein